MTRAVFAIPGDKEQRTGGYIYDATVLRLLNESGCPTTHLELPGSYPTPPPEDMVTAVNALAALPANSPVIVDGLALGAMPPDAIAAVPAPVIALVHHPLGLEAGVDPNTAAALIYNETAVLRQTSHVIVPSAHIACTLRSDFGVPAGKITVANPGFDRPSGPQRPSTPPLILSVGLLVPRKGHDVLIEALSMLTDLSWKSEIVGRRQDATYAASLEAQIDQAGLGARVRLTGEIQAAELNAAYLRASIFALATRYEGYGMVLSEAMLHHLPVVSCAVGAVPSTMGDAGRLVPADDAPAFAQAMRILLEDPEVATCSARASAMHAASLPTWHDTVRRFVDVIDRVTP